MQLSPSALAAVIELTSGNNPDYPAAYAVIVQDLEASNPGAVAGDADVLHWLSIAQQVNSGATTPQAIAIRADNAAASALQLGKEIDLFGSEEQAASDAIAASFFQAIDPNGNVPDFQHIINIDAQKGPATLGLRPDAWAGAVPDIIAISPLVGFTTDKFYDGLTSVEQTEANITHIVGADLAAIEIVGREFGLSQTTIDSLIKSEALADTAPSRLPDIEVLGAIETVLAAAQAAVMLQSTIDKLVSDYKFAFQNPGAVLTELVATIFGCPHLTTYDGTHVDFQGAGEFIGARSTQPGDTFQVQMRIEPEGSLDSAVSIITQIAVQVGTDRVTFGVPQGTVAPRPQVVAVNGTATTIDAGSPLVLSGGTVTEVSSNQYQIALNTGEVVTINPFGDGMGLNISLSPTATAGSVQGFLGTVAGQGQDFQLPDGTVLPQPLTQDQLYHQFADAWRVTDSDSLFDYGPGQTTATFTDTMYPREILTLADFSPDLVAKAAALAAAAGITDPTTAADAEFDYLSMGGNTNYFTEDPAVAALNPTTPIPAVITQPVTPPPSIGILPVNTEVTEATDGTTSVSFVVNLTSAATTDTVVDYTAVSPTGTTSGKDFLTAADFGGTLPSGVVTIPAGQTKANITIDVPNSAIGAAANKWLVVTTSSPSGNLLYSPTAIAEVLNNNQPVTPVGFDGDQVTLASYYPNIAPANNIGGGSATVTPGTTTFPSFAALENGVNGTRLVDGSLTLDGDKMTFLFSPSEEGTSFYNTSFTGYDIQTAADDPAITAASIISTNIPGLTATDLSFSDHTVDLNVAGLTLPRDAPGSVVLGFSFAGQSPNVLTPVHT